MLRDDHKTLFNLDSTSTVLIPSLNNMPILGYLLVSLAIPGLPALPKHN